ncbi:MAG: His/Gly/Thr/Pro-type tRNA ligase C-terminal domain-containing protein [Bacillus subtilis]|nr:His/Gly/Thr/Pro-type tRNA ligase C-terminal domain-containing protein [Bacillus subtilis]
MNNAFHLAYGKELVSLFVDNDLRVEIDDREEKLGYKIREAQTLKIPFQLVLGDKEVADRTVTYRRYGEQEQTTLPIADFIALVKSEKPKSK